MNLFKTSKGPRELLAAVSLEQCHLFNNVAALRESVEAFEAATLTRAKHAHGLGNDRWSPSQYRGNMIACADPQWPAAKAVLDALEASADYQEARRVIEPLLVAKAQLEKDEEAARQQKQAKLNAVADALAKASAAALAKAESDPSVLAARKELEALGA